MDGGLWPGQPRRRPAQRRRVVTSRGSAENTIAVVKISQPVSDGDDLSYSYKVVEGKLPASGGATALFIDKVGVGGGVGAGFHGVGVGGRGPGVR